MDELEALRKRKMELMQRQFQSQARQQLEDEQQAQEQLAALESMVKPRLTKDALMRYGNVKAAHPDKAVQVLVVLARLIQMGRAKTVSDELLKSVLQKLAPDSRETKIIRK
ncbi:hypothetical protein HY640_00285 [Candidatus Woesearchaeota archaeon]|nr:hypothetical protein [Candidatus Woesearchaeota archaeon]